MTTPQTHGDTEAPLSGFDAVLHTGFHWIQENIRSIGVAAGVLLLLGVIGVVVYEVRKDAADTAITRLLQIEMDFAQTMGAAPGAVDIPEPANEALAKRARETALAEFDAMIVEHDGTDAATLAGLRAAEMELDLGRLEAADQRLAALAESLDDDDPRRSIALRLRGYTLEARGQYVEAGEVYSQAAQNQSYPPRALLFLSAAENFERAGAVDRAITSYEQVLAASAELAQAEGVLMRMQTLEARTAAAGAAEPAPPATPAPEPAGG